MFKYVVFHRETYNTSVTYSSRLQVLDKDSIVAVADQIGQKLVKSHTKERLAQELSEYVRQHAAEVLRYANDDHILLLKELIDAGPNAVVWKRHMHKYDFLKMMVWVVVNYDKRGKKDGSVMIGRLTGIFMPITTCFH